MGECHNFKDGDKSKTSRGGNFFKPLLKVEVKKKNLLVLINAPK